MAFASCDLSKMRTVRLKRILPVALARLIQFTEKKNIVSIIRTKNDFELRAEESKAAELRSAERRYNRLYKVHLIQCFEEGREVYSGD